MGDMVPRKQLVNQALVGGGGIIGGIVAISISGILGKIPILGWLLGPVLGIGGLALLGLGGFALYKFIKNMSKRM
jgi:hypothetical protein